MTATEAYEAAVDAVGEDGLARLRAAGLMITGAESFLALLAQFAEDQKQIMRLRQYLVGYLMRDDYAAPLPGQSEELILCQGPPRFDEGGADGRR